MNPHSDEAAKMYFFVVPLRSFSSVKDAALLQSLLERTLRNLLSQTKQGFQIILVCNEVPSSPVLADRRISVVQAEMPIPRDVTERRFDMNTRISIGAEHAFQLAGSADFSIMKVDADDLIAVDLIAEASALDVQNGFVVKKGYFHRLGATMLYKHTRFHEICGSCISLVMRRNGDSLFETAGGFADLYLRSYHPKFPAIMAERGRPLAEISSYAAIYTMNYGENSSGNRLRYKWKPWRMQFATRSIAARFPGVLPLATPPRAAAPSEERS